MGGKCKPAESVAADHGQLMPNALAAETEQYGSANQLACILG